MEIHYERVLHLDRSECVRSTRCHSMLHHVGALCQDRAFADSSEVLSELDDHCSVGHLLGAEFLVNTPLIYLTSAVEMAKPILAVLNREN